MSTLSTILAGVAVQSVETSCLAGNIPARDHAMRDYAVPAKSGSMLDVTAGKRKSLSSVANVGMKRKV